jgi:hypothetical protein
MDQVNLVDQVKLICRLTQHVFTPQGDFIPNGTPVQVIGRTQGMKIEVMSIAHIYADAPQYEHIVAGESMGCTNKGLFFDVSPESIIFDSVTTVRLPLALMPE